MFIEEIMQITHKANRIKLQTNIDINLHHRFKTACFLQGKGMNEVLTELITLWLETNEGQLSPYGVKKNL
ncbi:plasmid partition protein ParG [Pseudescherichia vulneris]